MANNIIQFKRTSTSGNLPNTTNSANGSYIPAGAFAVNLTDYTVVSSNGTSIFYIGANVPNQFISGTSNFGNTSANIVINSTSIAISTGSLSNNIINASGMFINGTSYNITNGNPYNWSATQTYSANIVVTGSSSSQILVGNSTGNVTIGYMSASGSISPIQIGGSANSSIETSQFNSAVATNASSDFVAYDTNGPQQGNYIDLGINGNNYMMSSWTINGPSDGYLYTANTNLAIGTASIANRVFFAGNTTSQAERFRITPSNTIIIANSTALVANGSNGSAGQILSSNGSGIYWGSLPPLSLRNVISNTNITTLDNILLVTANSTITLPLSNTANGIPFQIKNVANSIINILPIGSDLIDGYSNVVIQYKNSMLGIISNGSGWTLY